MSKHVTGSRGKVVTIGAIGLFVSVLVGLWIMVPSNVAREEGGPVRGGLRLGDAGEPNNEVAHGADAAGSPVEGSVEHVPGMARKSERAEPVMETRGYATLTDLLRNIDPSQSLSPLTDFLKPSVDEPLEVEIWGSFVYVRDEDDELALLFCCKAHEEPLLNSMQPLPRRIGEGPEPGPVLTHMEVEERWVKLLELLGYSREARQHAYHIVTVEDEARADAPGVYERIEFLLDLPTPNGYVSLASVRATISTNNGTVVAFSHTPMLAPEDMEVRVSDDQARDIAVSAVQERGYLVKETIGDNPILTFTRLPYNEWSAPEGAALSPPDFFDQRPCHRVIVIYEKPEDTNTPQDVTSFSIDVRTGEIVAAF